MVEIFIYKFFFIYNRVGELAIKNVFLVFKIVMCYCFVYFFSYDFFLICTRYCNFFLIIVGKRYKKDIIFKILF